jgi:energy-coupling factor transport system permease protein
MVTAPPLSSYIPIVQRTRMPESRDPRRDHTFILRPGRVPVLSDISLGRYIHGDSILHRLDPRTKTIATVALSIGAVQGTGIVGSIVFVVMTLLALVVSGVPAGFVWRSLRAFTWLLLVVVIAHMVSGGIDAWLIGLAVAVRLLSIITLASLLGWTTQPLSIVAGLRSLGSPLARVGVPVDAGATAIGLALRFAPIALSEAHTILRAQAARGADFRGVRNKLAVAVPLLGALFERAFSRADTLAEAMEARGFVPGGHRTSYRELLFAWQDLWIVCVVVAWVGLVIALDTRIPV